LGKAKFIIVPLLIIILFSLSWLIVSQIPADTLSQQINAISRPYRFDIGKWEVVALSKELGYLVTGQDEVSPDDTDVVLDYFDNLSRIRGLESVINAINAGTRQGDLEAYEGELDALVRRNSEITDTVEKVLEKQIAETMMEQGIYNPWAGNPESESTFPPVNFILSKPPRLLVVSPRDRIVRIRDITLVPDIEIGTMEDIEDRISELDYSGLVTGLGGVATYPSYVTDNAGLQFALDIIIEEWLHQYLAFKPLGFLYILDLTGIKRDYDIATMNETLAGIVSKEIGDIVYNKYYSTGEMQTTTLPETEPGFDFNKEMREIRRTVDDMLARGEIELAEAFMEEKRQVLLDNGYYIRKLNQAYFAFHGNYADSPTSIDPIGDEMRQLREESDSLPSFLDTVSGMTTRQELAESID